MICSNILFHFIVRTVFSIFCYHYFTGFKVGAETQTSIDEESNDEEQEKEEENEEKKRDKKKEKMSKKEREAVKKGEEEGEREEDGGGRRAKECQSIGEEMNDEKDCDFVFRIIVSAR